MSTPRIRAKDGHVTLVRSVHSVDAGDERSAYQRETTVAFTTVEWRLIVRTVFADYGLTLEHDARERIDRAYQEAERAQAQVARLEKELKYASGEEADVDDPPPLLAHGSYWASPRLEGDE